MTDIAAPEHLGVAIIGIEATSRFQGTEDFVPAGPKPVPNVEMLLAFTEEDAIASVRMRVTHGSDDMRVVVDAISQYDVRTVPDLHSDMTRELLIASAIPEIYDPLLEAFTETANRLPGERAILPKEPPVYTEKPGE